MRPTHAHTPQLKLPPCLLPIILDTLAPLGLRSQHAIEISAITHELMVVITFTRNTHAYHNDRTFYALNCTRETSPDTINAIARIITSDTNPTQAINAILDLRTECTGPLHTWCDTLLNAITHTLLDLTDTIDNELHQPTHPDTLTPYHHLTNHDRLEPLHTAA